jgi:hypothetical protein
MSWANRFDPAQSPLITSPYPVPHEGEGRTTLNDEKLVNAVNNHRISSPASTGGAGTSFEQHVAAYWLAQLLVHGIPPILIDTVVNEVSFQTERLGWQTDDFLIVCECPGRPPKKLAGQVKRNFTVSATNAECVQAIGDFWKDFSGAHFSINDDRFVLVTLRGTNTLLEHFAGLLDCARASRDGIEFEQRLATEGFISDKAISYCRELQRIVSDLENRTVTAADLWPFLRVLHVLSLDLFSSTRQTEAHVKSLLAHTVTEGDAATGASTSWSELISIASSAMAESRSLHRTDLPAALVERHSPISTNEQRVLQALKDHTDITLRGIRSTIGPGLHLQRAALVQEVLGALEGAQVVLVTGPAGSGKSAIGKDAVTFLAQDHFVFGFRVEEFAESHLDRTLASSCVPANATALAAILAAQDRKIFLVESVERLLEKTTRDAFSDLMTLAADDRGMRVILTCRTYSIEQVRASFLRPARIQYTVVNVPPLDDLELSQAASAIPALANPLTNPALRDILRNPFFLDKAFEISWSAEKPLPESEREFRLLFWREIVRAEIGVPPGMGRRREEVLQEVAVRRARALSAFVLCNDFDPAVIESLRRDSLLSSPDGNLLFAATGHDVLEDWAILQWLEEQHLTDEGSFKALSAAIGAHPAIRRSYRKWVAELIEHDTTAADRVFLATISEADISMQFRDDTLVSLLKAPSAPGFLVGHETQLLANDSAVLRRVIHLLRIACVKMPDWLVRVEEHGSSFHVPDGPAWPTVLMLVHRTLASFTRKERGLLLGLIEDAVRNVSWQAPELDGAEYIAGIAHWLLDGLGGYGGEESRKRVLKVIAKIPKADASRFEAVLRGTIMTGDRRDRIADELCELIYMGSDGMPAARDFPDLIVSVGADYLLASESDVREDYPYAHSSIDLELYFGIKEGRGHSSFPASALRGPWMYLLRFHPRIALDFFIRVFNHCADWYAHPRLHSRLEPPLEVELTFADGTTTTQWANPRLWGLYRGTSMGPHVLESMLMALENWLLELGKQAPSHLDALLIDIMRRSESAALAAVVTSIATAYPHASGEALLVLLGSRYYVQMDRSRLAIEPQISALSGMLPVFQTDHRFYEGERKTANALPHRAQDLEAAVANLQLGPLVPRVHAILDRHLAMLPPKEEQEDGDWVWRLAIHRMDLRQYTVSETPGPVVPNTKPGEPPRQSILLEPKPPDADVQEMVNESGTRSAAMCARLGLLVWGLQAFNREDGKCDLSQWAEKLDEARSMDREIDHEDGSHHGPGFVAAVCIRDHWVDMTPSQQDWCVDIVCCEVLQNVDPSNPATHAQRNPMAADRASAYVLALLIHRVLPDTQMERVRQAFVVALTHAIVEVRLYTAWSIDATFWDIDRTLALCCVNAIATEAGLIDDAWEAEVKRPYAERRNQGEIVFEVSNIIRTNFWQAGAISEDAHCRLDITKRFGAEAANRVLIILEHVPNDPLSIEAFTRASNALIASWKSSEDRGHRRNRYVNSQGEISKRLQEFLLRTSPEVARIVTAPLLDAIDNYSHELQSFLQGLTGRQDSNPNTPQYWFLWRLFSDAVKRANWVPHLGDDHPIGGDLLSAIFLTAFWKDSVRHWRYLEGYAYLIHDLFEALPQSSIVLDNYVQFLYHIGEQSLPGAFVHIAKALHSGNWQEMLKNTNTVFLLEILLQRHVYGRPLELKSNPTIREAVLLLLDNLVETGSSAAFQMRDDFVTPAAS